MVNAIKNNHLTTWTVKAHKEEIKIGDKVILWLTGKEAGCYALCEVESEIIEIPDTALEYKYNKIQTENTPEPRVKLKITHNLTEKPILKKDLGIYKELSNLKVGNQGTNFIATKEEYEKMKEIAEGTSNKQYWLYVPGERAEFWKDCQNEGIMCIGWDEIGDLNQYSSAEDINKALLKFDNKTSKQMNTLANWEFQNSINVGDVIFAKTGQKKLLGYGVVQSDYYFDVNREHFQKCRKVKWEKTGEWLSDHNLVLKTLTNISNERTNHLDFEYYYERLFWLIGGSNGGNNMKKFPLNSIFYGPPGTGKTYNTIKRAAEIITGSEIPEYSDAKRIFNENLNNRIEFITFHQNYSYEDFIQGLRPEVENSNSLTFEKKDGIFKIIADRALDNLKQSQQAPEELSKEFLFKEALELLKDKILESDKPIKLNETAYFTAVENDALRYSGDNWTLNDKGFNGFRMKYSDLMRLFEEGVRERNEIKNLNNISGLAKQHATYFIKALELVKSLMPKKSLKAESANKQNYVIIIDEINRANISRVFGELITLIEEDKRTGNEHSMKAKLPSGDNFEVPSNLYIIGTMNTADKSIALLDIALRRRFVFEPMYPDYTLVVQEYREQLQKLNKEISDRKGYDFQIGHSYFMKNDITLEERMNLKVIPLLLEYFMNDEKEVREILGIADFKVKAGIWPLQIEK